jgi:colicin import membrane protein
VAPASHSVAEAEARLAKAAADRARAEAAFAADEQQCYNRFMVNNCLDKAREKRRQASSGLRAIEIEAERFLRQAKVDDRDRDLAKAQAEYQAGEARAAAAPPPARTMEPPPPAADPGVARQRAAAQAAKLKNAEAGDQAGAARRAANVQAFEKRKRQSAQRQKEIAEKKKKAVNAAEGEAK